MKKQKIMIDTHTHLYSEEFDEDRTEMIKRAINKGVTEFYFLPLIQNHTKKCFN
jgi:TatD DNase family protein